MVAGDPFLVRFFNVFNDLLHTPILEDLIWYLYWFIQCCLGPFYGIGLLLLFIKELAAGLFFSTYEEPKGRAILVTGCDTGFGHDLAVELYKKGWKVYAGCLTEKGMQSLNEKAASIVTLKLDVTKESDIDAVVKRIRSESPQGLFALVNNAGVGKGGVIDWMPMQDFRTIMEVNFFSVVAMTKACLPLLKENWGRIVNVTSMAGLFLGTPCMSAYSASKHAAEAFTSSLRFEMNGWGIKVITVNPSFHRTAIATNAAATVKKTYESLDAGKREEYGPAYLDACVKLTTDQTNGCWDPKNVVRALVNATLSTKPKVHYIVGCDAKFYLMPLLSLPTSFVERLVIKSKLRDLVPAKAKTNGRKDKSA